MITPLELTESLDLSIIKSEVIASGEETNENKIDIKHDLLVSKDNIIDTATKELFYALTVQKETDEM